MRFAKIPVLIVFLVLIASCKSGPTDPVNPNPADSLHGKDSSLIERRLPADLDSDQSLRPTLKWIKVTGATRYEIQISTSPDYKKNLFDTLVTTTSVTLPQLMETSRYFWQLRSIDGNGPSEWSATWSFTTLTIPNRAPGIGSTFTYQLEHFDSSGRVIPGMNEQVVYTVAQKDLSLGGRDGVRKLTMTSSSGSGENFLQFLPNGDVSLWFGEYWSDLPIISGGAYGKIALDSTFSDGTHVIVDLVVQNLGPFALSVGTESHTAQINTLQRKTTVIVGSSNFVITSLGRYYWVKPLGMYARLETFESPSFNMKERYTLLSYSLK